MAVDVGNVVAEAGDKQWPHVEGLHQNDTARSTWRISEVVDKVSAGVDRRGG